MTTRSPSAGRFRWQRLLLTLAAFGCGAAGQYWLTVDPQATWVYAWGGALILFLLSYFLDDAGTQLPSREASDLDPVTERILFAVVLAVGAFFSFYGLDRFPPGLNHDAAWEGLYGIRILNGEPYTPYAIEAWGRETLTFYLRAASIWLMGPTSLAVLAPGILLGFLTLPLFYWWARNMFGPRFALVATLLFGVSGWHLVFSRTGWRSDFQPFFTVFTCAFFVRGMLTAKPLDFVWAGVGLALTVNVYNAARVFPALFVLWLVAVRIQSWTGRGFRRRYLVPLLFMAAAFLIVIAPLAWFAATHWAAFQSRLVALQGQSTFGQALQSSLLLFNVSGNGDDFFVTEPALEYPAAVLFVFGLAWTVLRWKDERAQFLLLGFVIGLLPGLVSRPNLNRDVGTMPFVYFFVGMGAVYLAQQMRVLVPRIGRYVAVAALVAICVAATEAGFSQYLGPQPRRIWGFYPETTVIGRYLRPLVGDNAIWVGGDNYPRDSITYLTYPGSGSPTRRGYTWVDDITSLKRGRFTAPPGKGLVFVLANNGLGQSVFRYLERRYPNHVVDELRYPEDGGPVFAKALRVSAGADGPEEAEVPAAEAQADLAPAGELREPRGVAAAPDGSFYVCDFGHDRVQQFDAQLEFVRQWGSTGSAPGQFRQPCGIAVGDDGVVFVADTWNHRVQAFSPTGAFLRQSPPQLYGARGIATGAGRVFVADTGNNRIVSLSKDLAILGTWGEKGSGAGQFLEPTGVAVDADGDVYVADNGNGRLQRFSSKGEFKSQFPVEGWRLEAFSEPHLVVDDARLIWVTVPAKREVRAYTVDGEVVRTIAAAEGGVEPFDRALGIALGGDDGGVVVGDLANRLVRLPAGRP